MFPGSIKIGRYQYRLKQTDFDGTFEFSDIAEAEFVSAGKFSLEQNYPNPFNPSTQIEFSLPEDANNVKLTVYNTLGQKIAVLVNSPLDAGSYQYNWNAHNEGIYLYELRAEQVCFSQENDSAEMKRPCRKTTLKAGRFARGHRLRSISMSLPSL